MQIIYLDVLAALNFAMDYGILRASGYISGRIGSGRRLVAASGLGAGYAVLCVLLPLAAAAPLRLLCAGGLAAVAFDCPRRAVWIRSTMTVLLVSFIFGGCVSALSALCGADFYQNGVLTVPVSRTVLLTAALLAYAISAIVFRRSASGQQPCAEWVTICSGGRTAAVRLLRDSGNLLHDPETGKPVLILTMQSARALFPEALCGAEEHRIPYCALGGTGWLKAWIPEEIRREDGSRYDAVIALSEQEMGAEYDGLIADRREELCGTSEQDCARYCGGG